MKKIAFLFSAVALMAVTLTSCSNNSPKAAADKWLNSFYHMDYNAAKQVSTEETKKQIDSKQQMDAMMSSMGGGAPVQTPEEAKKLKIDIKDVKNTSDTTADVTYTVSNEATSTKTLKMVKRNKKWLAEWSKMGDSAPGGTDNMPTTPDPSMPSNDTGVAPPADGTMAPAPGAGTMSDSSATTTR